MEYKSDSEILCLRSSALIKIMSTTGLRAYLRNLFETDAGYTGLPAPEISRTADGHLEIRFPSDRDYTRFLLGGAHSWNLTVVYRNDSDRAG